MPATSTMPASSPARGAAGTKITVIASRDPVLDDHRLIQVLLAADADRPAAAQLCDRLGISIPTAYKYLRRALTLGAAERRAGSCTRPGATAADVRFQSCERGVTP